MKKFTDLGVRSFKAAAARREVRDPGCENLYLLVQPSGKKSWACRFRVHGKSRKFTIGPFPAVSVAEAREQATAALALVAKGTDPIILTKAKKAAERKVAIDKSGDTIDRLSMLFLDEHARAKTRESSWQAVERSFTKEVLPAWKGRLVADISRKDIKELIRGIHKTRPAQANRVQAHLSRFFRWAVNEDYVTGSPLVGMDRPAKENIRDRALNDDEIRAFWAATDKLPKPFGDIYRLLLLSGCRRQEVGGLEWRELDTVNRLWNLPAARSKSTKPHILPLGDQAWEIIERQPRISEHVFGWVRRGFSTVKPRLDAAMKTAEPWRTHDLRRTARSLMSRAKVNSEVAEFMLGHLLTGMRKVYDKHRYLDEKRDGFAKLEREIDLILRPQAADVIPLRR